MIPVQNIYYMLSYVFEALNPIGYLKLDKEKFTNVEDLYAKIISLCIEAQIKRGLGREYIPHTESITTPRGRIDITASIKEQSMLNNCLVCSFDEFSVNSYMNRIIKTTVCQLLKSDILPATKKALRRQMKYFDEVETIDIHTINWKVQYNRNNQTYRMLIEICHMVLAGFIQRQSEGYAKMPDFESVYRKHKLYERFILAYYKKEFKNTGLKASSPVIRWAVDDGYDDMLPCMETDITLSHGDKTLIIDAKYYGKTTQVRESHRSLISVNLYQIFTYVKNKEAQINDKPHEVSGMLLYAKTDEEFQFEKRDYHMSGNRISARTLNLECDFSEISAQLNAIAEEYFGIIPSGMPA